MGHYLQNKQVIGLQSYAPRRPIAPSEANANVCLRVLLDVRTPETQGSFA